MFRQIQKSIFLSIFLITVGFTVLMFQNCSKSNFTEVSPSLQQFETCHEGSSICVGNKIIRTSNNILIPLGQLTVNTTDRVDDGFYHLKIKNPDSLRIGYIKIGYNESGRLLALSDPQSGQRIENSVYMCYDHALSADATIVRNSDGDTIASIVNCISPIRIFDDQTVIEIGNSDYSAQTPYATAAMDTMRLEIPMSTLFAKPVTDPYYDNYPEGCRCRFNQSYIDRLIEFSRNDTAYKTLHTDLWIRNTLNKTKCEVAADSNGYFSVCEFSGRDFEWKKKN